MGTKGRGDRLHFPGQRIARHYFPVREKTAHGSPQDLGSARKWYLLGLDQILADMEVRGTNSLPGELGLIPGESVVLDEADYRTLLERLTASGLQINCAAGGTVANTLNNYTFLSGETAVLLGAIQSSIQVGQPAFHYVAQTPGLVDLSRLIPVDGSTGTAITFVGPDGERSFAVAPGISNQYPPAAVEESLVAGAAVALTTLYCLRDPDTPIAAASLRLMELAHRNGVPLAFGLGTAALVRDRREQVIDLMRRFVTVAAMNDQEALALTGRDDALLACRMILDWVDLVIITEGSRGLTMGGFVDKDYRRETDGEVRSKSIPDYNRWEYSRMMRRADCRDPQDVYTHIHPYCGGPARLSNTSGAGDAALAAVLHDIAANQYHRSSVPDSRKHTAPVHFLTYSSLSRNAQYGNRVAYEVLRGDSPRLHGPVGSDRTEDSRQGGGQVV